MTATIYMPAVSLKLLEPSYQCTLHPTSGTVLAHITAVHQMLNWPSLGTSRWGLSIKQYLKMTGYLFYYGKLHEKLQLPEHRIQGKLTM